MPTYEYICKNCEHEFEEFQSMSAAALKKCPECGKNTLERKIGLGGGIIFKGGGFYETDYRSDSYKKAAESDSKAASGTSDDAKSGHVHTGSCACGKKPADQCSAPAATSQSSEPAKLSPVKVGASAKRTARSPRAKK